MLFVVIAKMLTAQVFEKNVSINYLLSMHGSHKMINATFAAPFRHRATSHRLFLVLSNNVPSCFEIIETGSLSKIESTHFILITRT